MYHATLVFRFGIQTDSEHSDIDVDVSENMPELNQLCERFTDDFLYAGPLGAIDDRLEIRFVHHITRCFLKTVVVAVL